MADIYQFPGPSLANVKVSPELTTVVRDWREVLGVQQDSNSVITQPLYEGYEAFIRPNGAIQLGRLGLEDFDARFAPLEDVDARRLYINYTALRAAIETVRKRDENYHEDLLAMAPVARKIESMLSKIRDPHKVESEIVGYHAACLAMRETVKYVEPAPRRANRVTAVKLNAEKRLKLSGAVSQLDKDAQKKVMRHFVIALPYLDDKLDSALFEAVRRAKLN